MPTTLTDIAKKLDLSPSLVSKVLNNRRVWASDETRERVHSVARMMGYRPSSSARALRRGKTGVVTLVLLRPDSSFYRYIYSEMMEMIAEVLAQADYSLAVRVFSDQEKLMAGLDEISNERSCDAMLLIGPWHYVSQQGELLSSISMPFLAVGRYEELHPDWYQADFDHEGMMEDAVAHLAALGHKRIAYIGFDGADPFCMHLRRGYQAALETIVGGSARPEWIVEHLPGNTDMLVQAVRTWFDLPADTVPSAVVIGAGDIAWRGLELVLAEQGRLIGEKSGQIPVAGLTSRDYHLFFGDGYTFSGVEMMDLATQMVAKLLLPMLRGEILSERVLKLRPRLVPTMRLQTAGIQLSCGERKGDEK